jgi:hypothetical protein
MAFLQRVINGGGDVYREMAAGTGRLDLCIEYANIKYPIELKIYYNDKYIENGLNQLASYMDKLDCREGWLAVFDRRPDVTWDDKIKMQKKIVDGKTITIVGL